MATAVPVMTIVGGVARRLEALGGSADDVARTLRQKGVRGVRNTARFLNPIVRYAQGAVSDTQSIDVMQGDRMRIVFANGEKEEVALPPTVRAFLNNFHRGAYPEMEMPNGGD
jgi:hypothetical protein